MNNAAVQQSSQPSDSRSATRIIKVGSTIRVAKNGRSSKVPFIRLSGKWLEDAGFEEGDYLEICVQRGELRMLRSRKDTA